MFVPQKKLKKSFPIWLNYILLSEIGGFGIQNPPTRSLPNNQSIARRAELKDPQAPFDGVNLSSDQLALVICCRGWNPAWLYRDLYWAIEIFRIPETEMSPSVFHGSWFSQGFLLNVAHTSICQLGLNEPHWFEISIYHIRTIISILYRVEEQALVLRQNWKTGICNLPYDFLHFPKMFEGFF